MRAQISAKQPNPRTHTQVQAQNTLPGPPRLSCPPAAKVSTLGASLSHTNSKEAGDSRVLSLVTDFPAALQPASSRYPLLGTSPLSRSREGSQASS